MMVLFVLAYLGGVLTIVSPCILPVIPFVLARADRPFLRNGLPMLVGMALAFAVVATLASVAGGWVVSANQYGRMAALTLLAIFGVTLLFPELADRLMRPLVAVGARLSQSADQASDGSVFAPLLLGVATGFLWAPCAGPVLGLILTGAALQGASVTTTLLLLTYAAGAATSLALALLIGGRVFAASFTWLLAIVWITAYGCAMHAAGFFMERGIKLFGWAFVVGGCGVLLGASFWPRLQTTEAAHYAMGIFFGVLQLAYGIYLYFTEQRKSAA